MHPFIFFHSDLLSYYMFLLFLVVITCLMKSGLPFVSYGRGKGRMALDSNDKVIEMRTMWALSSFKEAAGHRQKVKI